MIDIEKCRIIKYPQKVLTKPAEPVEQINDNIRQLVDKMVDIMLECQGIGLAAPQVGVPLRLFVTSLDHKRDAVKVYINPTVTTAGSCQPFEEGCLSVPGVYSKIKRHEKCTVTATDLDGNEFSEEAEDLYARCLQHEYDHIEGVIIVNRMGQASKIMHRKQLKKLKQNAK